jgi:hypothetical protein
MSALLLLQSVLCEAPSAVHNQWPCIQSLGESHAPIINVEKKANHADKSLDTRHYDEVSIDETVFFSATTPRWFKPGIAISYRSST